MNALLTWLDDNLEKPFLVIGLLTAIALITWQVLFRYIFAGIFGMEGNTAWAEELSLMCFIWCSYLAVPIAIKKRDNLAVTALVGRFGERGQNIFWIIDEGAFLLLCIIIIRLACETIAMQMRFPQYTTAVHLPYWVCYLSLPISFGLMALRLLQNLWRHRLFRRPALGHGGPGGVFLAQFLPLPCHLLLHRGRYHDGRGRHQQTAF